MSNGKGDKPRNCFSEAFRNNYDSIFRKKETEVPVLEEFCNLDKECLMTFDEWIQAVESGWFVDYDGHGRLATKDSVSDLHVFPSEIKKIVKTKPDWATHVCWYNK